MNAAFGQLHRWLHSLARRAPAAPKTSERRKSPLSIGKTRRVVRQALAWARQKGMVVKAPLPEQVAIH
jgi:hypothetical protein